MRLSAHGCVAPPKRDFTSVFMDCKVFIGSAQNAHIIWVEPVGPLACLPGKNKIRYFSDLNGLNPAISGTKPENLKP
jgi:hypothetical protein